MIDVTMFDTVTGTIVSTMRLLDESEIPANTPPFCDSVLGAWDARTHYVDATQTPPAPTPRPTPPTIQNPYPADQLPVGTTVRVVDDLGDEHVVTDMTQPIVLADPGTYQITVKPPAPWFSISGEVTV